MTNHNRQIIIITGVNMLESATLNFQSNGMYFFKLDKCTYSISLGATILFVIGLF